MRLKRKQYKIQNDQCFLWLMAKHQLKIKPFSKALGETIYFPLRWNKAICKRGWLKAALLGL